MKISQIFRLSILFFISLFCACSESDIPTKEPEEPCKVYKPLNKLYYGSYGIDISEYQGDIDFDIVEQLCHFCIMRASAGTKMLVDNLLETNYAKAEYSSLRLGYYHYFNYKNDPEMQADLFLSAVKGKRNNFPLVIDIEHSDGIDGQNLRTNNYYSILFNLNMFIEKLEDAGEEYIFYTNKRTLRELNLAYNFYEVPIWIADYSDDIHCDIPNICIRQFCCDGKVQGIEGDVDLNIIIDPNISNDFLIQ